MPRIAGSTRAVYWLSPTEVSRLREQAGETQAQLAERSGLSRATVSLVERGKIAVSPAAASRLADALNVGIDVLIGAPTDRARGGQSSGSLVSDGVSPALREATAFLQQLDKSSDAGATQADRVIYFALLCPNDTALLHGIADVISSLELNIRSLDALTLQLDRGRGVFEITSVVNQIGAGAPSHLRRQLGTFLANHNGELECFLEGSKEYLIGDRPANSGPRVVWINEAQRPELRTTERYGAWLEPERDAHVTSLFVRAAVSARDRLGLVRDVAAVLLSQRIALTSLESWSSDPDGAYTIRFVSKALSSDAKNRMLDSLRALVEGVQRLAPGSTGNRMELPAQDRTA